MKLINFYGVMGLCMLIVFVLSAYDKSSTWVQVASCTTAIYYLHIAVYHSNEGAE